VFLAVTAIAGLFLTAGCGSSNGIARSNPVGFSNSSLNGTYVFSTAGEDGGGYFIVVAGALTADGNGGISGGTMDIVDSGGTLDPALSTSGSYSISSDGRGKVTAKNSAGTFTFDFVLSSSSHGLITEFDSNATGSGTLDLQTSVPTLSQLAGSYAFSLSGIDNGGDSLATLGAFTLNSNGNITAGTGVEDFNDSGIPYTNETLTGSATAGSATTPGQITLVANFGALTYDVYPIDATHWKVIETDFTQLLAGDVFSQLSTSIPTGPYVFTMSGGNTNSIIAVGGVMTSTGGGSFTGGLEDVNNTGQISQVPVPFTGAGSTGGGVGGRTLVALTSFVPATTLVTYPSSGGLLMMELDSAAVTLGTAYAQTSQALPATNYAMNLSAFNTSAGLEEDDIAQFLTTGTSLSGVVDINDDTQLSPNQSLSGSYAAPDSTGRGTATTTAEGSEFVDFTYYVADSSTILLLETDTDQIGTGIIQTQSAPGAGAATTMRMLVARPGGRPHAAFKKK
jgi:hypothetical protein